MQSFKSEYCEGMAGDARTVVPEKTSRSITKRHEANSEAIQRKI